MNKFVLRILIVAFLLNLTGCAVAKINSDKKSWFIGWGSFKDNSGAEIKSDPPIKFPDFQYEAN